MNANGHSGGRCSMSYSSKRKATFGNDNDNVICYQIQSDNESTYSVSDPHIISSKKLSVGLRRWVWDNSSLLRCLRMLLVCLFRLNAEVDKTFVLILFYSTVWNAKLFQSCSLTKVYCTVCCFFKVLHKHYASRRASKRLS